MTKILSLKRTFWLATLALFWLVSTATAQPRVENAGEYNVWTKTQFARQKSEYGVLTEVRSARHKNFDRVVFVFKEKMPTYRIEFAAPPFNLDESDETVDVAGKKHVQLTFLSTDAHDLETGESTVTYKKGKLGLPTVAETALTYDHEAMVMFVVGLNKAKDFRVAELTAPARLVVDFKH